MTIREALDAMRLLADPDQLNDWERGHIDADAILCTVLTALAQTLGDPRYAELVTLYEQVEKWYA